MEEIECGKVACAWPLSMRGSPRKVGGEVLSTMRYSVIKGKTPQCYMCFNLGLDWDKPNKVLIRRSLLCSIATCSLWLL
jgi:hypothetical protein